MLFGFLRNYVSKLYKKKEEFEVFCQEEEENEDIKEENKENEEKNINQVSKNLDRLTLVFVHFLWTMMTFFLSQSQQIKQFFQVENEEMDKKEREMDEENLFTALDDPANNSYEFVKKLELCINQNNTNEKKTKIKLKFFMGSYLQLILIGKKRAKFLFVILLNFEFENGVECVNKIICNPQFIEIFENKNVIVWGGDVSKPEAYQVANSLKATMFPYISLLSLSFFEDMSQEDPTQTKPKIFIIQKFQGNIGKNSDNIIELFKKKIFDHTAELNSIQTDLWKNHIKNILIKNKLEKYQNFYFKFK